jgi:hypothetical protein
MTSSGQVVEMAEPIPGFYCLPEDDNPEHLRKMFPKPFFANLWEKHPMAFGEEEECEHEST